MNESQYQRLLLLEAPRKLPDVRLFRRNVGQGQYVGDGVHRVVTFGIKGQSDCYAIVRGGKLVELEIKALGGSLTKEQRAWRDFCQSWGVPWLLLKPLKDEAVDATIARWCEEIRCAAQSSSKM